MAQETAIVAGGCFWCTEAVFRDVIGVSAVESGYIGGTVPDPTYKQVCSGDTGHADFVVERLRAAFEVDRQLSGRLALWGRRLMGEALTQAQRVAAERDALAALIAGGVDRPGLDLVAIGRMFARMTERHAARMTTLGLAH